MLFDLQNPRGWNRMLASKKRQMLRDLISIEFVRANYRGSTFTVEEIHEEVLSAISSATRRRLTITDSRRLVYVGPTFSDLVRQFFLDALERLRRNRDRISCIYKLSKVGIKGFYIGRTIDLRLRMVGHSGNRPVNKGITEWLRRYGHFTNAEGLKVEIVERLASLDHAYVRAREQHYISTLNPLWNRRNEIAKSAGVLIDVDPRDS